MKRQPVAHSSRPSYPQRRARSWALGLLARGGTALAGPTLGGCTNLVPPIGPGTTMPFIGGDVAEPAPGPAPSGEPAQLLIPEIEEGEVIPEIEELHVLGDMPQIGGDVAAPLEELEVELEPEQVAPPDHRIAGGMPAPRLERAPVTTPKGDNDED